MKNSLFLFVILAVLLPIPLLAQAPEDQIKAEFVERFTRFIDWPEDYKPSGAPDAFVIAVIGDSEIRTYLAEIAERQTIKGKAIRVVRVAGPDELTECHVLLISESERRDLSKIIDWARDRPILTVADSEGFGERGVLINFYREDKYIRFEINRGAVEQSGLRLSSKLLRLAKIIGEEGGP